MKSRRSAVARIAATAVGLLLLAGVFVLASGSAGAGVPATPVDPASTTTIDQSLTTTPPLDADDAPDYDNGPDLDMDRITGPRVDDGKVTGTTFWPLGFAAVAILAVFGTIFYRAARGNRGNQGSGRTGPRGAERGTPSQPTPE